MIEYSDILIIFPIIIKGIILIIIIREGLIYRPIFPGQKCLDPCPGSCGVQAVCTVDAHNPICSCSTGFTGDPFTRCLQEQRPPRPTPPRDPCNPTPCGLNANCKVRGNRAVCSCIKDYQVTDFSY